MLPAPRSPLSSPRIAVIGAGISGLAAAHRLVELLTHARIVLFEASNRLGGILDTVHRDGFLVERSADNFLTKSPAATDLCRRLGLADQLLRTDETRRRATVVRDGRLLPIPDGFYLMSPRKLGPLLKSPVLSPLGKLRLLAEPLIPRRATNFDVAEVGLSPGTDESVADFACRRLGREIFERLVQPLVAGIFTADPAKLSMAATMPEFVAYERDFGSLLRATLRRKNSNDSDSASGARYGLFATPKNGLTSLVAALADRLPPDSIRLRTPIANIQRTPSGLWQLNPSSLSDSPPLGAEGLGEGGERRLGVTTNPELFDALIIALPAPAAAKLLASLDHELAAELAGIPYASAAVVSAAYRRSQVHHPLDSFGFVVPQVEGRRIIAASFSSQKFTGRAPNDSILIRTFLGGAMRPELVDLSDDELARLAQDELTSLLGITGMPLFTDVARWREAMPQYHVGHVARVERIEHRAKRWPSFALAGNAYHGVGIPQCISSGESAAELIAAWFS